jgi:integrase
MKIYRSGKKGAGKPTAAAETEARPKADRRFRFTHAVLEALPPHDPDSASREMEYSDDEIVGLRLMVSKTGRKFFYLRFVLDGRKGAVRIGEFPSVSLKEARTRAHEHKAKVARGEDPRVELDARAGMPTVAEFFAKDFLPWAREHKRSWRDDELRFNKEILPRIGRRRMCDVTAREVQALHVELRRNHAVATCNRYLSLVQRLFSYANELGVTERHPARQVKKYRENNARQRYLSKEEVARFLEALDALENRTVAAALRFLLFTGLRKGEACGLRWEHVQLKGGTVFLPDTKGGRSRTVVLNGLAREVLEERWAARKGDCPWVFPGRHRDKPVVSPRKLFDRACAEAGIEGLHIHDLRHTFASLAINGGASLYDVQRLLGHASTTMTQRYAHLQDSSVKRASERVAQEIRPTRTTG